MGLSILPWPSSFKFRSCLLLISMTCVYVKFFQVPRRFSKPIFERVPWVERIGARRHSQRCRVLRIDAKCKTERIYKKDGARRPPRLLLHHLWRAWRNVVRNVAARK